jgi:hypothetical protein
MRTLSLAKSSHVGYTICVDDSDPDGLDSDHGDIVAVLIDRANTGDTIVREILIIKLRESMYRIDADERNE